MTKRELIKGKDTAGHDLALYVVRPGHKDSQDAQLAYSMKVAEMIRRGAGKDDRLLLRSEVEGYLAEMGLWTKDDEIVFGRIQADIRAAEITLRKGGIKLQEARRIALHMSLLRGQMLGLYAKRSQLDGSTVEATAENYKFNFLVTRCVLKENGHPYFADVDEYLSKAEEEITVLAAQTLAKMIYGFDEKFSEKLFESQWLRKFNFMDKEGRLTDRQGHLVDADGRLIDENGRFINQAGELIDREGNPVDEKGDLIIETAPFIDDATGEEVKTEDQTKTKTTKRSRKKSG